MKFGKLSTSEKEALVQQIWDSVAQDDSSEIEISSEHQKELDARLSKLKTNPSSELDWSTIKARATDI